MLIPGPRFGARGALPYPQWQMRSLMVRHAARKSQASVEQVCPRRRITAEAPNTVSASRAVGGTGRSTATAGMAHEFAVEASEWWHLTCPGPLSLIRTMTSPLA